MKEFKKYQHIARFNTIEVENIEEGECFIFPKLDGTNVQLWWDNDVLHAGSRNRELTIESDNRGFFKWALEQKNIIRFFKSNPDIRIFGEWLVPHQIRSYENDAWNNFYVFDVCRDDESYMTYFEYSKLLFGYCLLVPIIDHIINPTVLQLNNCLKENTFLVKENSGFGEGIVIKNYDYKNKFGRRTWAKIIAEKFNMKKEKKKNFKQDSIEEKIVEKYVTEYLVNKEYEKLRNEWSSKMISKFLGVVYYCLVTEECWEFVKAFKKPVVDFKKLQACSNEKVKEIRSDLFC